LNDYREPAYDSFSADSSNSRAKIRVELVGADSSFQISVMIVFSILQQFGDFVYVYFSQAYF